MEKISVMNLGISALLIEAGGRRILVDAFNSENQPVKIMSGDIILFTHDDNDHFYPDKLPMLKGQDVIIIGPPSIIKPILLQDKADIKQIEVLFTVDNEVPSNISNGNISIKCYHTSHFNHWDPIHNSYLIEVLGKRLYITGDSILTKELAGIIGETDAVICNLVEEGFLKGYTKAEVAVHHNLSYLLKLRSDSKTKKIIGVHQINFPWTVDADIMKKLVGDFGFQDIIIPVSSDERIVIE